MRRVVTQLHCFSLKLHFQFVVVMMILYPYAKQKGTGHSRNSQE